MAISAMDWIRDVAIFLSALVSTCLWCLLLKLVIYWGSCNHASHEVSTVLVRKLMSLFGIFSDQRSCMHCISTKASLCSPLAGCTDIDTKIQRCMIPAKTLFLHISLHRISKHHYSQKSSSLSDSVFLTCTQMHGFLTSDRRNSIQSPQSRRIRKLRLESRKWIVVQFPKLQPQGPIQKWPCLRLSFTEPRWRCKGNMQHHSKSS